MDLILVFAADGNVKRVFSCMVAADIEGDLESSEPGFEMIEPDREVRWKLVLMRVEADDDEELFVVTVDILVIVEVVDMSQPPPLPLVASQLLL
jgi:hypothetical protein